MKPESPQTLYAERPQMDPALRRALDKLALRTGHKPVAEILRRAPKRKVRT